MEDMFLCNGTHKTFFVYDFVANASVGVNLFQHLVDVDTIGFLNLFCCFLFPEWVAFALEAFFAPFMLILDAIVILLQLERKPTDATTWASPF